MSCHPECRWACNDPMSLAACTPVCDPPNCTIEWRDAENNVVNTPVGCEFTVDAKIVCPEDMCETENCPTCETVVQPLQACPGFTSTVTCVSTSCVWDCQKPLNPTEPDCELKCQTPTCDSGMSYTYIAPTPTPEPIVSSTPTPTSTPASDSTTNNNVWRTVAVILVALLAIVLLFLSRCWTNKSFESIFNTQYPLLNT
jgi:hypothetical protein